MQQRRFAVNVVVLCLVMSMTAVLALAQVTTGAISGTVQDESGAFVPGASVTVRNAETGLSRNVSSDDHGRFRAPSLPLGNYDVRVEVTGFQTSERTGIELTIG